MPYKLSQRGLRHLWSPYEVSPVYSMLLTDLQKKALEYLGEHQDDGFIESSEIAKFYDLAPQAMRGPLHGLWLKGLVEKDE